MQTNLRRVSEFSVLAEHTIKDETDKSEVKTAIKRFREHDSDSESEIDEIAVSTKTAVLPDIKNQGNVASDPWLGSLKSEASEVDTTVFLSFDWENEGPYEKAVERYHGFLVLRFPHTKPVNIFAILFLSFFVHFGFCKLLPSQY